MIKKIILSLLLVITSIPVQKAIAYDTQIIEDQKEVENGLRYPILITNHKSNRMSLSDRMAFYNSPGLSIAIIDQGKIIWSKGYGNISNELGASQINSDTLFQAASISKSLTAYGALLLVQEGKMLLDENINNYLKRWKIPENEFTKTEKVTLRRLLSHTAGTTVHGFPGYSMGMKIPSIIEILDGDKSANTDPIRVDFVPGSKFRYSGGGTTIVQLLIEDITGESFDSWMYKNVLYPLNMTNSTFSQPLEKDCTACGHYYDGKKVNGNWHIYPEKAAAGLWTTPTDLAKFILHIQSAINRESHGPLSSDMIRMMITKQGLNDNQEINSAIGLFIDSNEDNLVFQHNGRNEGFLAKLYGFALLDQGIVVMTNNDSAFGLIDELINSVADVYGWPGFTPVQKEEAQVDPSIYSQFCGVFIHDDSEIEISIVNDKLFADFGITGIRKIELHPETSLTYFMQQGLDKIEFVMSDLNKINEIVLTAQENKIIYKRKI